MNMCLKVVRYHLAQRVMYVAAPWAALAFVFAVNLIIAAVTAPSQDPTKALAVIYVCFFALGILSIGRSLPFGLALGVSRRSYYAGTALFAVALAAADGLALTLLQALERATGRGWGVHLGFFRVSYIFAGPWYLTWLTSFTGLALLFVYGMWFGIVYRRWDIFGLLAFLAAQVTVVLVGAAWHSIGHFFTALSAAGLTGVLATLAAVLLAGGFATIRRITV